jgi:hypothetical protein
MQILKLSGRVLAPVNVDTHQSGNLGKYDNQPWLFIVNLPESSQGIVSETGDESLVGKHVLITSANTNAVPITGTDFYEE